ncbi:hypothetical protein [Nannocystis pusilla]|uniref:hypothetical protein n=1 Tax=Nannocystis pusilla TaxID=889268 RepID=UPI003B7948B9
MLAGRQQVEVRSHAPHGGLSLLHQRLADAQLLGLQRQPRPHQPQADELAGLGPLDLAAIHLEL